MRLLVDGCVFENDRQRGVQRYFRELLTRVSAVHNVDLFLSSPALSTLPKGCSLTYRKERFAAHKWNVPLRLSRKIRRSLAPTRFSGHELFHSTFFTRSPEPGIPEVVTVYDMIPEHFEARFHEWGQHHIDTKRQCIEAARRIICISHATAADVASLYPHCADKLRVVHLGADHFLAANPDPANVKITQSDLSFLGASFATGRPYLLQIGDRGTYKNFGLLLRGMVDPAWPAELQLVVAGPKPSADELATVQKLNLQTRVQFTGPIADQKLPDLFRASAGFVFPSLGEGFGFPLLEAQSLNVPVICSDIAAFRETAGGATIFFDPLDPASLAIAAGKLLHGEAESNRAVGLENVRRFRWDQCAVSTLEIYGEISDNRTSADLDK